MIRLEVKGANQFPRWIQQLPDMPRQAVQTAMQEGREFLLAEARKNVTKGGERGLNRRTGNLERGLRTKLDLTATGAEIQLTGPFYGRVNARGAVITAKHQRGLLFFIPGVGWRRSARIVIPARPWDEDALRATQRAFPSYLQRAVRRLTVESP